MQRARDTNVTRKEYEETAWRAVYEGKAWEAYDDLEDYVCCAAERRILNCIIGKTINRLPAREYYTFRRDHLLAVISRFAQGENELIELGCGYGFNLFSLCSKPTSFTKLLGLDISEMALAAGRQVASHYGIEHMTFMPIDLLDGKHANFARITGKVVFTYHCLEQLRRYMGTVVENLVRAAPKRVIHIEPTREMLNYLDMLDINSAIYSIAKDYPDNLLNCLRMREQRGQIRLLHTEQLYYAPTPRHMPALIVWEPVSSSSLYNRGAHHANRKESI